MRHSSAIIATLALLSLAGGPGQADNKSFTSKIGIHLLGWYSAGARKIIQSNCPVITLFESSPEMMEAARDYKLKHPNGIVVVRYYHPVHYVITQDPKECAKEYWERGVWPGLSQLSQAQRKLIDYVEGPNECELLCWRNAAEGDWNSRYSEELIRLTGEKGFRACIGNIPVGNPPGDPRTVSETIRAYIPALRLAKKTGGCWAYHAYTLKYTKDPKVERDYSLRYRRFYEVFARYAPDLLDMPLILAEGGVDNDGTHNDAPGWKRDTPERYKDWLQWFDSEIKKDSYVKGVTLFEIGDPGGWGTFDLEPISDWLADYLSK